MFTRLKFQFEEACNLFIRPPRHEYEIGDLGKNPLKIKNTTVFREDLVLSNSEKKTLKCSFFQIKDDSSEPKPCVVYLHCNAGSRCEVLPILSYLVTIGINVFAFDMSGCGMSEGEYVTLGLKESLDVRIVVDYLLLNKKASSVGLWGRSMGAVTALKYAEIDSNVSVLIVDSPFSNLNKLAFELAKEKTGIPNFFLPMALGLVKKGIKQKVNIKFGALDLTKFVHKLKIPICFLFSYHDEIIKHYHVEKLFELYGCPDKKLISVKGRHNDARPASILKEVGKFCFDNFIKKDETFKKRISLFETFDLYNKYKTPEKTPEKPPEKTQVFDQFFKDSSHGGESSTLKNASNPQILKKNEHCEFCLEDEDLPSIFSNISLLSQNETKFITKEMEFNTSLMNSKKTSSKPEIDFNKKFIFESEEEKYDNYSASLKAQRNKSISGLSPIHHSSSNFGNEKQPLSAAEKNFEIKVFMN